MSSEGDLDKFFEAVDQLSPAFISRLKGAVQIQSVSADHTKRHEVESMATFLKIELQLLNASVTLHDLGDQEDINPPLRLPPVVTAQYPKHYDSGKKTLLVYGHYDVQPKGDGHWTHEAFDLTEADDKLYGRGSTDDKGPVCGWLNVIEAYQKAGVEIPVNLVLCFEGMEEQDSDGFPGFMQGIGKDLFQNVDAICIADNYWLTTRKPCLTYGLRGIDYFTITISGPGKQLHSGIYGGTVHEPMTDLVILLSKLVDPQGRILIPGIEESVEAVTASEKRLYDDIDYKMEDLYADIQSKTGAVYDNKVDTLMHRMRYPSLTIHGISGADATPEFTTSIAPEVMGKFSIRTVPDMSGEKVTQLVTEFLDGEFKKLNSPNQYHVKNVGSAPWWRTDPHDANFIAAGKATEKVYNQKPDLTREGGSIGVTLDLQNALQGKGIMLLPMGTSGDGAHGPNEKIDKKNYIEGTKLFGAYFHYFASQSA